MTTGRAFLHAALVTAGLAALAAQVGCSQSETTPQQPSTAQKKTLPADMAVMTIGASNAEITGKNNFAGSSLTYDGTLEAVKDAKIAAQVAGVITQLNVQAGDSVQRGQVLATIDDTSAQAQVSAAQAQVAQVQAQLDVAASELNRQKQLYVKNYISKAALERSQAQYQSIKAQLTALNAQTKNARTQQGFFVIKAPFTGVIAQTFVVQGDMAMPGQPLLTLYQNHNLRVAVSVPQSVASQLDLNQPHSIQVSVPALNQYINYQLPVVRAELLPMANAKAYSRTLRLYLDGQIADLVQNQGLTVGMATKVTLPLVTVSTAKTVADSTATAKVANQAAIYVPTSAVVHRGDLTGVYVVKQGAKPRLRQVRLGQAQGNQVAILSGLMIGDTVVVNATVATAQSPAAQSAVAGE